MDDQVSKIFSREHKQLTMWVISCSN